MSVGRCTINMALLNRAGTSPRCEDFSVTATGGLRCAMTSGYHLAALPGWASPKIFTLMVRAPKNEIIIPAGVIKLKVGEGGPNSGISIFRKL